MDIDDIKVYRMSHIDNIPHILQYGITHRNSPNANKNYIPIGDTSLINRRNTTPIQVTNGNTGFGYTESICVGDFIPFYFWVRMPMLYIIQKGYNNVVKRDPEEIVYLVCSVNQLSQSQNEIYFSDGHSNNKLSTLYDKSQLNNLSAILDWKAIKNQNWKIDNNIDTKRKKEAEFLVKEDIKPEFIVGFGCYNDEAKNKLLSFGIADSKIKIIQGQAYF